MRRSIVPFAVLALVASIASAPLGAQEYEPGDVWGEFGPWNSGGSFFQITPIHDGHIFATEIAADGKHRLVNLSTWRDSDADTNVDCGVTRYLADAKTLDMDFTGELEASRRVALNLGGGNDDHCTALAVDSLNRPVIAGWSETEDVDTAFVVRLRSTDGSYDTSFSDTGVLHFENSTVFGAVSTRFEDVATDSSRRIVACGTVERAGDVNLLVARFTTSGGLDSTFNGTGYREIDFDGSGDGEDTCDALEILPDGRIVLAGTADEAFGTARGYAITRLLENGQPDPSFTADGRVWLDDNSDTIPSVVDVAWDNARSRTLVLANATGGATTPSGVVVAVTSAGEYDTTFAFTGRRYLRFSDFGTSREDGATSFRRILMRDNGSFYVAGTHRNEGDDEAAFGMWDFAMARLRSNGLNDDDFSGDGVRVFAFAAAHRGVASTHDNVVSNLLKDAILYRGNVLLVGDTNRHPEGDWEGVWQGEWYPNGRHWDLGPYAPMVAGVVADGIWNEDFEPTGLAEPNTAYATIPVPDGYGRYCSVLELGTGEFGLLAAGATSDPCQTFLDQNPNVIVQRAGLYSLSGANNVLATCANNYVHLYPGNGTAPLEAAYAAASGQSHCIFTASPTVLPIFDKPYTGDHVEERAQSFNHNNYHLPLDARDFGDPDHCASHPYAHAMDLYGRQMCNGPGPCTADECEDTVNRGVNEAAVDIPVRSDRQVLSVASGRVASAVPRYRLHDTLVGVDPYQREVFVRHSVGTGRYSEQFTVYYAHMYETAVRRGDAIAAGTVIGTVGLNGFSTDEHLHLAVFRHKNLSWRSAFELDFSDVGFHEGKEAAAIDPWGWAGIPAYDPWAFLYRDVENAPENTGAWSIFLWKLFEAPTMYFLDDPPCP